MPRDSGWDRRRCRFAAAFYVGCVAGALQRDAYLQLIAETGFEPVHVAETKVIDLPDEVLARYIDRVGIAAFRRTGIALQSITVRAAKPAKHAG